MFFLSSLVEEVLVVTSNGGPFILLLDKLELNIGSVPLGVFDLLFLLSLLFEFDLLFGLHFTILILKLIIIRGS